MMARSQVRIPAEAAGESSSPGSTFCADLFRYLFHPCVTAVARKRSQSFCQMSRWQVTAKHAYILHMWLCMKWHGAWLYGVRRTCWDSSSFMWHQPCRRCKYTTSVDIQNHAITWKAGHSCGITCERSESAREWRKALYESNHLLWKTGPSCWTHDSDNTFTAGNFCLKEIFLLRIYTPRTASTLRN